MLRPLRSQIRATIAVVAVLLAGACEDPATPTVPTEETAPVRGVIACRADVVAGAISCQGPTPDPAPGLALSTIVGGQGTYVQLTSNNVSYASGIFEADVTVQNLMAQPMGTPDGTTVTGVRVFFHSGPTVTSGTGTVDVANEDGTDTFTASDQPYFEYNEILETNEVSAPKTWQWTLTPEVETFEFSVYVSTDIPAVAGLTGVWKFRYDFIHPNGQTRVTAELMIDQPDLVWPNEARRVAKFSHYNGIPDGASLAQTELAVAVDGSQVDLQFNDTDGLRTFSGTIFTTDSMGGGALGDRWYAVRSNDPPPPTVAAPTGLADSISSALRVLLDWTDNSESEEAFKIVRQCQGDTTSFAFDSVANVTSAMDFGRYGITCAYRVRGYLVDVFTDGDYYYTGKVFSRPSNQVAVDIPASPVEGITPEFGSVGSHATITGDFGADPSALNLAVNGQPAFILRVSTTEIEVLMPNGGHEGRMPVTVYRNGQVYGEAAWWQGGLGDNSEPVNNDAATSASVYIGTPHVGSFLAGDVEDWFQLKGYSWYGPEELLLQFRLLWNAAKDLDFYIMDSYGSREICGSRGVGSANPIEFQCAIPIQEEFGRVRVRIVDEDARSRGDTALVSYGLIIFEP